MSVLEDAVFHDRSPRTIRRWRAKGLTGPPPRGAPRKISAEEFSIVWQELDGDKRAVAARLEVCVRTVERYSKAMTRKQGESQ